MVLVEPSLNVTFLYFLRVLNSDIATIVNSMGEDNLPRVYDIAIKAKKCLI